MAKIEELTEEEQPVKNAPMTDAERAALADRKGPMTDAERLELAAKLDDDLDAFIDSLEKRQYTEAWPQDRWEEVSSTRLRRLTEIMSGNRLGNGQASVLHETTAKGW